MGFHTSLLAIVFMVLASSMSCLMSSSLPSEYSILGHDIDALLSEERVVEIFNQWKQNHGKVYKHDEEATKRFENFKRNLKYIYERNNNAKGKHSEGQHRVGLNKFADMSNEEFRQAYLSKVKMPIKKRSILSERNAQSCDAPSSFDWRKYGVVTAIKNQGSCGSCWAFSTTGAIEAINAIVTGNLISVSEQELVDCDSTNYGCDGGYMDYAFEWVINNGGIDSEANYPYTGVDGTCNITKEENKVVSINGYEDVEDSDGDLLCAVVQQPISVGMDASSIDFQLYTGGIYDSCSDDPDDIDHGVLIVGYGAEDDEEYWIVKNSWGTDWGIEGYFYLKRDAELPNGVCAVNAQASYPTKQSSSPSPNKNARDYLGVAAKERKMAKHKFPWTKNVEEIETEKTLQWKRNPVDAMR